MTPRALVTGGTRGIGRAVAGRLIADGARVLITGRDAATVDRAVRELNAAAPSESRAAGIAADVRDPHSARVAIDAIAGRFGGLDVLVNNAGVGHFADVASISDADWMSTIETNLSGAFYFSRAAIPELERSGGGWIINIASLAARNAFAGGAAYCASKAGLVAFTESLMLDVRDRGIRVCAVLPGSVATGFSGRHSGGDDAWKLRPADVAEVVADLIRHPSRSLPSRVEIRPARTSS